MKQYLLKAANFIESKLRRTLVQPWRRHRLLEEEILARLFPALGIDCVFDVGANTGQYALMLRRYCGYKGIIISFEPTPDIFAVLAENARRDPNWHVLPIALGQTNGQATFGVRVARESSSFLQSATDDEIQPGNKIEHEILVEIKTLNYVYAGLQEKLGFARPFLKMDTQGFDLEVFSGGHDVIRHFVGLQSELSVAPLYRGAPLWRDAIDLYEKEGFKLSALVPNNVSFDLIMNEIDCIMVRT